MSDLQVVTLAWGAMSRLHKTGRILAVCVLVALAISLLYFAACFLAMFFGDWSDIQ